ncbi:hypothetical protein I553_5384 [Mycobacterium xenopi 4042]|uniref:Rv2525c-like glycoside hydrolase-like domain-containing protein n=1 Tax=Mycobacterium xenopi 4042 TaxID=1299334 RepID=X7ZU85_MYCXE|nr:hypothetical protein I553_5384 [Mycobacterium xenopi 4042]
MLAAISGGPTASAAGGKLIDFTERLVPADQIKSAGYDGAVVYVAESRPGANFDFKPVTREYAGALRAAGLHVVSNYQYGKPAGLTHPITPAGMTAAWPMPRQPCGSTPRQGRRFGPIFFSIDEDIDQKIWKTVALEWFRGINSVLGADRTGIYGHAQACRWAIEDGVIGRSTTAGHRWAWQTSAWSHGEREPAAVLYQSVVNTPSSPGPLLAGTHVDVDEVLATDFGQWDLDRRSRA